MDLIYRGSSNITHNNCYDVIKNEEEWKRLKNEVMPKLFNDIYHILENEEEKEN